MAARFGLSSREGTGSEEGRAEFAHRATEELRAAATLMSEAQRVANFGSWEWRVPEDEVSWSDQLYRILGLEPGELEPTLEGYLERIHPEDRLSVHREIEAGVAERRPYSFECRILRADGEHRTLRSQGEPILDPESGEVVRVVGVCQDVSEFVSTERARDEADARFKSAFENAPIGIALVDFSDGPDGRLLEVNRALGELTGRAEELIGSTMSALSIDEDAALDQALRERLVAGEIDRYAIEKRALFEERLIWLQFSVSALPDAEIENRQGIIQVQDVTERKRFEDQLRYMADHDSLTGLMNRRRFREELANRIALQHRYGGEGALLLIDVDRLKAINDSRGHGAGDLVLRRVAEVMRNRMRSTDVVARLAGDEFAALLPKAAAPQAALLGEELISRLAREGSSIAVSVGVAPLGNEEGDGPTTPEEVIAAADMAMYRAKQRGGGVAEIAGPPTPRAEPSHVKAEPEPATSRPLGKRVWSALESGNLVLYAQPVVHLRSGKVAHREILVRMRDESGSVRAASEFLAAAAQEPGLCAEIDRWVLVQALAKLGNGSRGTRLHVNLSGETLTDEGALTRFLGLLAGEADKSAWLGLEIGEAAIQRDSVPASAGIRRLAATGCPLVLDGFTGNFGSFEYLQRLPLDQVKLDGVITRSLLRHDPDHGTLRAIVRLAQGTGKTTVAKRIESETLLPILRMHGVDMAQGFELGEPVPLDLAA